MSLISLPWTFTVGAVIVASQHNSNFSVIVNDYNGGITTANLASNAGIVDTQLAAITTAGKVSGSALTSLSSTPAGAGLLPVANVDTGTTANKIIILDGSAKLPAVDGSALTNLTATLSSIKDYGTSASSSTAKTQANLKIAYGSVALSGSSSQAITNLSFTSSSTYVVTCVHTTSDALSSNCSVVNNSGSQCTIYNASGNPYSINWIAVGT